MDEPTIDKDLGIAKIDGSSNIKLNKENQVEFLSAQKSDYCHMRQLEKVK